MPRKKPSIDAIVCYHNHEAYLHSSVASIVKQVRQCLIVDDGSYNPLVFESFDDCVVLNRDTTHNPANSFNYGAFHSNADWFLYVDPHCIFKPGAVAAMLKHAQKEDYDCVFGTGRHYILGPSSPWIDALKEGLNNQEAAWSFMMHRTLWEELEGIPEPPHAHIPVLVQRLVARGVRAGWVNNCVDHVVNTDFQGAAWTFYTAGRMDGILYKENVEHDTKADVAVNHIRELVGEEELSALVNMVFVGLYQLGVIEGIDAIPKHRIPVELSFRWTHDDEVS